MLLQEVTTAGQTSPEGDPTVTKSRQSVDQNVESLAWAVTADRDDQRRRRFGASVGLDLC